jgi:phosphate transport system substrate-binding protein
MYAKWAEAYKAATGVGLNYQSIGSSGGIRQIRAKTVAFGATDAPCEGADLEKTAWCSSLPSSAARCLC